MARVIDQIRGHGETWERLIAAVSRGHLPHAMVFTGPGGIGKRKVAWALAQRLVCESEVPPCGQCGPCLRVERQQSENVIFVEPENGVIKLESASRILEFLSLQMLGRARIVLIESAHLLNPQTGNALLKVIEEPPENTYFILLTPEISQLLPTLRSRVQSVRFCPLDESILGSDPEVKPWMLKSARGSFEQLEAFKDPDAVEMRTLVLSLIKDAAQDVRAGLEVVLAQTKDRRVALRFVQMAQQIIRDWCLLETDEILHVDLKNDLVALPQVSVSQRARLWANAFQMEGDLVAHVDRGLVIENFYYRTRSILRYAVQS